MTDNRARQQVLDAAATLQNVRRAAVSELGSGSTAKTTRVLTAGADLTPWLLQNSQTWRHVLSTRPVTTGQDLLRSLPNNRRLLSRGLKMISVFDEHGTEPAARRLLADEAAHGVYYLAFAPVQMRIVDRRAVYLHGPCDSEPDSIVCMESPGALRAALDYWNAVLTTVRPCTAPYENEKLTPRQWTVLELLRLDLTDDRIAANLGLSVRTVRYEIAAVLDALGVRSRFAAGCRYASLTEPVAASH